MLALALVLSGCLIIFLIDLLTGKLPFFPDHLTPLIRTSPIPITFLFVVTYVLFSIRSGRWRNFLQSLPKSTIHLQFREAGEWSGFQALFLLGYLGLPFGLGKVELTTCLVVFAEVILLGLLLTSFAQVLIRFTGRPIAACAWFTLFCFFGMYSAGQAQDGALWHLSPFVGLAEYEAVDSQEFLGWACMVSGWSAVFLGLSSAGSQVRARQAHQ